MLTITVKSKNTARYNKKLYIYSYNKLYFKKINIYKCIHNKLLNRHTNIKYFNKGLFYIFKKTNNIFFLKNVFMLINFIFNKNKNNYIGFFKDINGFMFCNNLDSTFLLGNFYFNNLFLRLLITGYSYILLMLNTLNIVYNIFNSFFISISPGVFSTILRIDYNNKINILLFSSGKKFNISYMSKVILGRVSNIVFNKIKFSNIRNKLFYKNKLISVRGCCKNPVDHHNGGNTRGKKKFLSFWNKIAKYSK